jgi:hypothetical protein
MKEQLSFRAYAARRGVSHTAVSKAVRTGRLRRSLVKDGARVLIDPALADREWAASSDPAMQRDEGSRAGGVSVGTRPSNAGRPKQPGLYGAQVQGAAADAAGEEETRLPPAPDYQRLRTFKMAHDVQLAKLELEERQGLVVRTSAVTAEAFRLGRAFRDSMRGLARQARVLMAERDERLFEQKLDGMIVRALERFVQAAAAPPAPHVSPTPTPAAVRGPAAGPAPAAATPSTEAPRP